MKMLIFLLMMVASASLRAQTLRDALYGGKLKTDSGTVIKKGDDLTKLIDTTTKKPVTADKTKTTTDSAKTVATNDPVSVAGTEEKVVKTEPKDNNDILKEYMDSVISTLKTDVLPNKKIKEGNYFVLVNYEIATDGQAGFNTVTVSPDNSFLQEQLKLVLNLVPLKMNPVYDDNGRARKVIRKYSFNITKE